MAKGSQSRTMRRLIKKGIERKMMEQTGLSANTIKPFVQRKVKEGAYPDELAKRAEAAVSDRR